MDFGEYGGDQFAERTLRWERNGNRVILRAPSFAITADSSLPVYKAVAGANYAPIIAVFNVDTYGPDSAAVVDVTRLFTTAIPELAAIRGAIDPTRSYVERVVAFPDNVEIEATQTGVPAAAPGGGGGGRGGAAPAGGPQTAESVVAHWSLVRLPEQPMMPRRFDERVGFFSERYVDFGADTRAARRQYITKYRLECAGPPDASGLCTPKKPIVYYVDPNTPEQWKPWVRKAINDWQPAFEAAGFKDGIVAMDAPANDPDWSPEDIRHTVIRWLPSTTENAVGPHVSDPRTGEILNGSARIFQNVINLNRDWYFTQAAQLDPRARTLPVPRFAHGPAARVRRRARDRPHDRPAARPDRQLDVSRPTPCAARRGCTRWGTRPASWTTRATTTWRSRRTRSRSKTSSRASGRTTSGRSAGATGRFPARARRIRSVPRSRSGSRVQDTVPWYRFSANNEFGGFGTQSEAVGDADPVKSTALGFKNIQRVIGYVSGAAHQAGEDNSDLREVYDRTVGQWATEASHVTTVIGGGTVQYKSGSQPGPVYVPLSARRQAEAVKFLNEKVFKTPRRISFVRRSPRASKRAGCSRGSATRRTACCPRCCRMRA